MIRSFLAAAVAFALLGSTPAFACPDCKDCPMHKDKVASAEKAEKKEAPAKCKCGAATAKDCKCGAKCACHAKQDEKKDTKKT
jgi:hypothetical protein